MKKNKKLIVIMSIIFILAVVSTVFAYLLIATDLFRSSNELFAKYFSQNTEAIQKILNLETIDVYKNLKNENKYESNTNIKMMHSEGGEVSNPLNDLGLKLNIQKNNEEQYAYADAQIIYEDEEYLEAEIIKEQETYGLRFTDAVLQFITIEKEENTYLNEGIISEEQANVLMDKYLNIITTAISNGIFEKQRDVMITHNNVETKTNAYSVFINSEQVSNTLIAILNNVKTETEIFNKLQQFIEKEEITRKIDELISNISGSSEIPTIKITVYEQKQKTIRTVVEIGLHKISIENIEQNVEIKTKIEYQDLNNNQMQYKCELSKMNIDNQEKFEIIINPVKGEDYYTLTFLSEMKLSNNKIELDTKFSHKQDITTISLVLENEINIVDNIKKAETLVSGNNISYSTLGEKRIQQLINEIVLPTINERIDLLKEKFGIKEDETESVVTENEMSQVEINEFNAKFEFYTGDEVSAENVKKLLDIIKNNVSGYENGTVTIENETSKSNIILHIEKGQTNQESITKALEEINDNKKYKIQIIYKESNGLIDYIKISEL